jgi:hypothetical protein
MIIELFNEVFQQIILHYGPMDKENGVVKPVGLKKNMHIIFK